MKNKQLHSLILKYKSPGNRYAYYPSYRAWRTSGPKTAEDYSMALKKLPDHGPISLYLHLPFCESLCTFCGCNIQVTKDHSKEEKYLEMVLKEWDYILQHSSDLTIHSLYIGGGTPNFFQAKNLEKLLTGILGKIKCSDDFYACCEIDPRFLSLPQIEVLTKMRILHYALGVQDLSPKVMQNVNRPQELEQIAQACSLIKKYPQTTVSFDLIYGLPHQNSESFTHTIDTLLGLEPDGFSFYPLAMAPWLRHHQDALGDFSALTNEIKTELEVSAIERMQESNYSCLGMGHFYKAGPLATTSNLGRNLSGHLPFKSSCMIGLGVSAFTIMPSIFWQNEKILEKYSDAINLKGHAVNLVHSPNAHELFLKDFFEKIICDKQLSQYDMESFYQHLSGAPKESLKVHEYLLHALKEDGLIEMSGETKNASLRVTEMGNHFLKNICQAFDPQVFMP